MRFAALAGDDCARSANDCSRIVEGNGFLRNIESLRSRCQVYGKPRAGGTEKMGRLSSWTVYCRLSFIRLVVRCSRTWISQNPKKISTAEFRGRVSMSVLKFAGVLCIDQDSMVGFELTSQVPFPQWQHTLYISILVCVFPRSCCVSSCIADIAWLNATHNNGRVAFVRWWSIHFLQNSLLPRSDSTLRWFHHPNCFVPKINKSVNTQLWGISFGAAFVHFCFTAGWIWTWTKPAIASCTDSGQLRQAP